MKFQVVFFREKLKLIESSLQTIMNLLKIKVIPHQLLFLYVASQNQIRILFHRQEAPIILVIQGSAFTEVKSSSKHVNTEDKSSCTMGFVIKNGVELLESLCSLSRSEINLLSSEKEKMIKLKIQKDQDFRYLQIRANNRNVRLEIQKPKTNQNQLFSYPWIDGVRKHIAYFQLNSTHFLQVLNPVWKYQSIYPFQYLPDKFVKVSLDLLNKCLISRVKTVTSQIISKSYLTNHIPKEHTSVRSVANQQKEVQSIKKQTGDRKGEIIHYKIQFSNCQQIAGLLKGQSSFILDEQNRLVLHLSHEGLFQCQILLSDWMQFVKLEKDGCYYKFEEGRQNAQIDQKE